MREDRNQSGRAVHVGVLERQIDDERIARRAYAIYEGRGRGAGHADDDWFQAVSEYAARRASESRAAEGYGASASFGDRVRDGRD